MTAQWTERQTRRARQPGEPRCDAFTSWAVQSEFRDSRTPGAHDSKPQALWLMLRLRALGTGESPPAVLFRQAAALPAGWLTVPQHYEQPLRGLAEARFCTALASEQFIRYLFDPDLIRPTPDLDSLLTPIRAAIEAYEIGLQAADWNVIDKARPLIDKAARRPPSIIGVIDDGLPFAHRRLSWTDQNGLRRTRFLALWDQSASRRVDRSWCLGRILDGADMDRAIAAGTNSGCVDEDAVYHHAGLSKLLRHRITHGAHVLDLACGAEPPNSADALPAIIGVQMRPMESTLCLSPGAHLFDAIRFVVAQADAACGADAQPCPVVVNASVGNIAGPHDGHSLFEEAVDELLAMRRAAFPQAPVDLVMPEGNSYLSRCHAWSEMASGSSMKLDWHLKPDDGTSSYLEIWFRPKKYDPQNLPAISLRLSLTTPAPAQTVTIAFRQAVGQQAGAVEAALLDGANPLAVVGLHPQPANGRYWMALVTVAPTAAYGPWQFCAPAGPWRIELELGEPSTPIYCNVYSQRDEKSFGLKGRGRQAVIEDGFDRFRDDSGRLILHDETEKTFDRNGDLLSEVGTTFRRRVGTINGMATGSQVRVVGGLMVKPGDNWVPARYSSVSIPVDETSQARRTLAFTEDSPVLHGLHAAGSRSGSVVSLSGTSMAAPQQTRALALRALGGGPAIAPDFNGTARAVILPAADLLQRSKRRRGEA